MEAVVGYVDDAEKKAMEDILEKKRALENLLKIVSRESEPDFYEDVKQDYRQTRDTYLKWWADVEQKYGWGQRELSIDMETGGVLERTE